MPEVAEGAIKQWPSRSVTSTMCTRLMKRTVSLSEICNDAGRPREHVGRDIIVKAIYEEWYFQKLRDARRQKVLRDVEQAEKQTILQKESIEKQQKAQENFVKWKRSKTRVQGISTHQTILKKNTGQASALSVSNRSDRAAEAEAFCAWKREKDKALWRKKDACKEEEERKKLEKEREADAEVAFQAWKKRANETLKLQARKENEIKKRKDARKQRQLEEKKENSVCCFNTWSSLKAAQMRKAAAEHRVASEKDRVAKAAWQQARVSECDVVFEEWLKRVDARDQSSARRNSRRSTVPWIPC